MVKLSIVITAFNEEKNIEACLQSAKNLADEIIVVDNNSTDKTATIAKRYTKDIFSQENDPQNIDRQKNFGFSKATGEWILSLDADEQLTPELTKEIQEVLDKGLNPGGVQILGYWVPRKNNIFGKWIEHTGWYPDYQLRLFRRGKGTYTGKHVHEDLYIDGATDKLTQPLLHNHYQTVTQFVLRSLVYIQNEAENKMDKGYKFQFLDAIRFPFQEFLSRFFAREGYKDGLHGLVLSLLMSWYHFMIFAVIWEKHKFVHVETKHFLSDVEQESKRNYKELRYWFFHEKIKQTSNLSSKYWLKLTQKL